MGNLSIINHDGVNVMDSRNIAPIVDMRHDNLLAKIDGYVKAIEKSTDLNFKVSDFFIEDTYQDSTGRSLKCYLLTRKGCDMVANKITGEKGVLFTAAYVTKFEEMEKQIAKPVQIDSKFLFQIAAQLEEKEKQIQVMAPKAEYFDALVERKLLINIRDTAKELKIKESVFVDWLLKKYVYRDSKNKIKPYAEYVPTLFELKEFTRGNYSDSQTLVTPRGRETFRLMLIQCGLIEEVA